MASATNVLASNLLTIANSVHQPASHFRIEKKKGQPEVIKKNGFIRRHLLAPFYSTRSHAEKLETLINKSVSQVSRLERDQIVNENSAEATALFIAAQKYNQTIARSAAYPVKSKSTLAKKITLNTIHNPKVTELNPVKTITVKDEGVLEGLENDKPEIVTERHFFEKHQVKRYPGDRIDHGAEANRIFSSTQKERVLSGIGHAIEAVAGLFGFKVNAFQKYHYRKNNELDTQIYAPSTNPLNVTNEPTSYWLGHATLFLSVPLKSSSGKVASFNVITDPVEGDLNAILYPRYTKFARPMEETPAPHVYLLSHNHFDHYSKETIKKIFAQQPVMVVPKGDGVKFRKIAKELGFDSANIVEMDWWQKKEITFEKDGELFSMQITATPARHWSGQGPCGGHESTFLGYVIQGAEGGDIYFAGDTARLNDDHIQKLKNHFNIRWNFQPGGPDEVRKDMESTHQASVDGLWMHFKMMVPKIYQEGMSKAEFLVQAGNQKTIYMHTMAFKLGNLHLSDTKDSVEKVLNALSSSEDTDAQLAAIQAKASAKAAQERAKLASKRLSPKKRSVLEGKIERREKEYLDKLTEKQLGLKSYEKQVYEELRQLAAGLEFADGEKLSDQEVSQLLRQTVIVPKIGSKLNLETQKADQSSNLYF